MNFRAILRKLVAWPDLTGMSQEIVARCRAAVWQRIQHQVQDFATAEARGYIRVRAASLVREEVNHAISRHNLAAKLHGHLYQLSLDHVVRQAMIDVADTRRRSQQPTEVPLRRAA